MVWLDCMERFLGAVEGLENQIQPKCNVLGSKLEDKMCSHHINLWVLSQPSQLLGFCASNQLQQLKIEKYIKSDWNIGRHATRWEAGGAAAPPDFGGSVNPISTRGDTLSPPSTTCPPGFLTLAACLELIGYHWKILVNCWQILLSLSQSSQTTAISLIDIKNFQFSCQSWSCTLTKTLNGADKNSEPF